MHEGVAMLCPTTADGPIAITTMAQEEEVAAGDGRESLLNIAIAALPHLIGAEDHLQTGEDMPVAMNTITAAIEAEADLGAPKGDENGVGVDLLGLTPIEAIAAMSPCRVGALAGQLRIRVLDHSLEKEKENKVINQ